MLVFVLCYLGAVSALCISALAQSAASSNRVAQDGRGLPAV